MKYIESQPIIDLQVILNNYERLWLMSNNQSLREAIPKIMVLFGKYHYSKNYIDTLRKHLCHVVDLYEDSGIISYKACQYQHFLSHIEKEYEDKNLRMDLFWYYRKCAYYLDEYFRTGEIRPVMLIKSEYKKLSSEFSRMLNDYLSYVKSSIKVSTLRQRELAIRKYLLFLQSKGYHSFESVSAKDIQEYFFLLSEKYSGRTVNGFRLHIRQFHHFLFETQDYAPVWISMLDFHTVIPRKIQGYLSGTEMDQILSGMETSTGSGKRDYAILSLAKTTGLRGSDIINLKLTDIDWRLGTISIIQSKTNVKIQLPLLHETGEAIKDYILNGRPSSDCPNVFLRCLAPYTALKSTASLDAVIEKHKKQANITKSAWDGKAFHGVRRGLGRELILADIPLTSVMQVLGHTNMDSAKPYIMLHTNELKKCALNFKDIPVKRGELLGN